MAINLQKPENEKFDDPEADAAVEAIYKFAIDLKKQGLPDYQIKQRLQNDGLDDEAADIVINNLNRMIAERQAETGAGAGRSGGSGIPGWLIWVGALILFNVLSAAFDWGFILY